jgi:hypothetical protein
VVDIIEAYEGVNPISDAESGNASKTKDLDIGTQKTSSNVEVNGINSRV